jgi:hypothetical protein
MQIRAEPSLARWTGDSSRRSEGSFEAAEAVKKRRLTGAEN